MISARSARLASYRTMIVVADTGPLHYLILLEHAELLLYGQRSSLG
jgi:hypothetical protein